MGRIVVTNHMTLDGVMQAPAGRPEQHGGYPHAGWAEARNDEVMGTFMGERMASGGRGGLLLGRRTYEDLAAVWPHQSEVNPYTKVINHMPKYVASRTLKEPLEWNNSRLLEGDVAEAVARLKDESDEGLVVLGSADLIQTLMRHDLIDEFLLLIHPVVLGSGKRLFTEEDPTTELTLDGKVVTTTTGVIIATYRG